MNQDHGGDLSKEEASYPIPRGFGLIRWFSRELILLRRRKMESFEVFSGGEIKDLVLVILFHRTNKGHFLCNSPSDLI